MVEVWRGPFFVSPFAMPAIEGRNTFWFSSAPSRLIEGCRAFASASSVFGLVFSLAAKTRLGSAPAEEFPDC